MRVVVTGASGFIGGNVVPALREAGAYVIGLSNGRPVPGADEWHACDVCDEAARQHVAAADVVVHLAALSDASLSVHDPLQYGRVNALGTLNVLEGARSSHAFVVLASSQRVYKPAPAPLAEEEPMGPAEPYGFSKVVAEQWLQMFRQVYGLPGVVLRLFSVYGPGQAPPGGTSGVASIFLHRALAGDELWVDGDRRADLTYVADVARGILLAIEHRDRCGPVYNVATGVGTPLLELARLAVELTGSRSPIIVRPRSGQAGNLVADVTRARRELGYEAITGLREGLTSTLDWLQNERAHIA